MVTKSFQCWLIWSACVESDQQNATQCIAYELRSVWQITVWNAARWRMWHSLQCIRLRWFQLCLWRGVFHLAPICLVTLHLGRKAQGRGSMYWYLPLLELCSDVLRLHEYCNEAHSLHYSSASCWLEDADVRAQAFPATGRGFPSLRSVRSDRSAPPRHPLQQASRWCAACDFICTHTKETVQRWWIIEGAKSSLRCSAPGLKLDLVRAAIRNGIICIYIDWNVAAFLQTRAGAVRFSLCLRVISLIECWCVPEEWRTDRRWKKKCREGGPSVRLRGINTWPSCSCQSQI